MPEEDADGIRFDFLLARLSEMLGTLP